jgi:hypothetical protein
MSLKPPNPDQVKFLDELKADPKLGTKYTDVLLESLELLGSLTNLRKENLPSELTALLITTTAHAITDRVEKEFPNPNAGDKNPTGIRMRHDLVHYMKLCGALGPERQWDEDKRKLVG